MTTLTASQVSDLLGGENPPLLIHVLPPEHFETFHIHGAINVCIYETSFVDQVKTLAPDSSTRIIVYGQWETSSDSQDAAEKLEASGYSQIFDFRWGLSEWSKNDYPLEGTKELLTEPAINGNFNLDTEKSVIRWTGRNLFNHHEGTLKFSWGNLNLDNSTLKEGSLTIDMNTLSCYDLTDSTWNAALIHHLRTADFFDVEHFPTAAIQITHCTPRESSTVGTNNYDVSCALTLRGIWKTLSFPAVIAAADGDNITAQAQIEFDRTDFGSHYGSGKFFAFLWKHVVNDKVQLHLKIIAKKQS